MDEDAGFIMLLAGDLYPDNYMLCDGSILNISDYNNLFTVIGTKYGGDGVTTFALPDLRGRAPVGCSFTGPNPQFPQLTIALGNQGGGNSITLADANVPSHTHPQCTVKANVERFADSDSPDGTAFGTGWAMSSGGEDIVFGTYVDNPDEDSFVAMNKGAVSIGKIGGKAHENMMPYLGLNFYICVDGAYPDRS